MSVHRVRGGGTSSGRGCGVGACGIAVRSFLVPPNGWIESTISGLGLKLGRTGSTVAVRD